MKRPAARASGLEAAKAEMAALLRDRNKRRFHHNWEKAIAGLVKAARGRDRAAGLYEAAKARYALYRWSADEADREQALRLAGQAARLGAADAKTLAQAIRHEAGDDRPAQPAPRHRAGQKPAPTPPPAVAEDDEPADPALERVVKALSEAEEAAAPAEPDAGPARISEVKAWSSPDYARVAIYLSRWVAWQKLELPADRDHPRRLAIDLAPALLEGATLERPVGGLRLSRVRAAQFGAETVRVVLDLAGQDHVQVFRLDDPPRLVLDLASGPHAEPTVADGATEVPPAAPSETAEAGKPAAGASGEDGSDGAGEGGTEAHLELSPRALALLENRTPAPPPSHEDGAAESQEALPAPLDDGGSESEGDRPVRRIVVDAGHGGHDPGAIGPTRLREKDVTLSIARKLAQKLRDAGFEVVLTRKDDRFLALEERTAMANAARGDLFVSVHANAHPRRSWNGVETYFLNVTDDRYARRLAARENGIDMSMGSDLTRILTDLDAKASADESVRLARLVQRDVCGGVRARVGDVRDLGVKSALFYVLLGARMPAVLVETGFISNRAEEKRLASQRYQDEVASGIAQAVRTYAASRAKVANR